jgi:hypothetical protein
MTAVRSGRPRVASLRIAFAAAMAALLSACGTSTNFNPGTPVLTLSSTNTRFACYIVTIDQIVLYGPNNQTAVPLPVPVTVDLTRQTDLSSLLSAYAAPQGTFTTAVITIDYTYADIWVNNNGVSVHVAPTVVVGGNPVLVAGMTVTFDPTRPLVVTNQEGIRAHLNFDLDAFNTIDLPNLTVTVNPYVAMNPPQPQLDHSNMRVRGYFVYAPSSDAFVINILPFDGYVRPLGGITVDVTAQTYYNINGVTYVGAAGLQALSTLPLNVVIAAYGTLSSLAGITPTYTADTVIAGTSLESPVQDRLTGVVKKRTGNVITVLGGQFVASSSGDPYYPYAVGVAYLPTTDVQLDSSTVVSEDGVAGPFDLDSISVGQQITASGVGTFNSSGAFLGFSTTAGQVRLQNTVDWGVPTLATPNSVSLDLVTIGGWATNQFDFTGTAVGGGAVLAGAYPVNTGSSDQSASVGTLLELNGNAARFGTAAPPPGTAPPAFNASSVFPGSTTQQELVVEWVAPGTTKPFVTIRPTELIINMAALGPVHSIYTGPVPIDLKSLPPGLVITTVGADQNQLVLSVGGTVLTTGVSVFSTPATAAADYSAALSSIFAGTHTAVHLVAFGNYNSASNTFVATRIDVGLQN